MAFTDNIHDEADEFWSAIVDHPMVEQLGSGTLDEGPFRYWVRQDYVYLVEYSRLFALGASKAPTLDSMGTFASLLESTVNEEMDLHRSYAAEFGIDIDDLEATTPSPTTRAYTDFLIRTATHGTFGDIVAALLPCMWGFNETGRRLAAEGVPDHEQYAAWVEMYASDEFTELTEWCKTLMNDVAADATPTTRERYRELFRTSAQYEYLFWDAAWRQEEWPL
ncbi:thiaminase II (plasmid) [Haloferax mediterranei ATCC 33500]|uniref:TENA/THI-4 family protein n=1 Tax=Haloferax mediterranei (strain ATCC 33500 / DSM 1411 / JCM 8866 / NBRC 14739 / NCIMB 2177 / R-4) TaxID=523841 RepID=I3RA67_HALMT|nr:thiaminase II [Haloferax mediterranei]AFK21127.1 transcriptional activator TenA [Haloferax mediterranei ATCC 33500]AHZ24288.1 TENA/THI-4 family protein [Haloferax mediterranei ATCC 33500]EMA05372.1 transcriptional activator TenA [Haloferax mediterranei ATCC 33500]MDX5989829.1 thiaminase II [Haloferax mediterranei ATCC 33500]QCQ77272.1 thiaminase II [Haloferax mediterranei ATCC 33500]